VRLAAASAKVKQASGVAKPTAAEDVRDLKRNLAEAADRAPTEIKSLEAAFIRVARRFSEKRGIGYGALRDAGVPAAVLKKAGIPSTRGA
jgi:hypothetical protein